MNRVNCPHAGAIVHLLLTNIQRITHTTRTQIKLLRNSINISLHNFIKKTPV